MTRLDFTTEALLRGLSRYPVAKGDHAGHAFHGNQWVKGFTNDKWEAPDAGIRVNYDANGNRYELKADPYLLDNSTGRYGAEERISVEVTNKDGERVGLVTARYHWGDGNINGPIVRVWHYEVKPELQGQGIARQMMDAMHDNIRWMGEPLMFLHSGFVSNQGMNFANSLDPKWNRVQDWSDVENKTGWRKPSGVRVPE